MSAGGAYVLIARDQLQGDIPAQLELDLSAAGLSAPGRARCTVVWRNDSDHDGTARPVIGLGLRFDDQDSLAIRELVRQLRYTVLLTVGNEADQQLIKDALAGEYDVICCAEAALSIEGLGALEVGVLIADAAEIGTDNDPISKIAHRFPGVLRLVVAEADQLPRVNHAISSGRVLQYLRKPLHPLDVRFVVQRAIEVYATVVESDRIFSELHRANERLERENAILRVRAGDDESGSLLVGTSPALQQALAAIERVRHTDITVHIRGETGTGKELVARALHNGGLRAKKAFIAHNCGGMTETLLQSTLFGHKKGSFTGADRDQPGLFQEADGGTLFLDEIAELTPAMQSALLRVLQEGEIMPVGATRPVKVDVRVVSATMKDLRDEVAKGNFRVDLFYRLVVMEIELPPLRKRTEDIPILAQHFLEQYSERYKKRVTGFTPQALAALKTYSWPGNVRELQNVVERATVLTEEGRPIPLQALPPSFEARASTPLLERTREVSLVDRALASGEGLVEMLDSIEREILQEVMNRCQGNQSEAARQLKLARQTLQHRLRRLGLVLGRETSSIGPRPPAEPLE